MTPVLVGQVWAYKAGHSFGRATFRIEKIEPLNGRMVAFGTSVASSKDLRVEVSALERGSRCALLIENPDGTKHVRVTKGFRKDAEPVVKMKEYVPTGLRISRLDEMIGDLSKQGLSVKDISDKLSCSTKRVKVGLDKFEQLAAIRNKDDRR